MDLWAPGVNLRPSLLAAGTTDRELRRLRRNGDIVSVRPGANVAAEELDGAVAAHLHAACAAAARLGTGSVLSRTTAAVVGIDGLLLTSLLRTLLDVARHPPFEQALVPVDAALHQHRVTPERPGRALERAAHRAGNTAARQVLAFARAGAASPGETRSRVSIHRAGLPAPVMQHELHTAAGLFLGRVDFW